jgi:hypothetical protein
MKKEQPTISQRISSAKNLKSLCATLNEIVAELKEDDGQATIDQVADLANLPTFGGNDPEEIDGVWSWDKTSVLEEGDGNRWSVRRRCACGEAPLHCICSGFKEVVLGSPVAVKRVVWANRKEVEAALIKNEGLTDSVLRKDGSINIDEFYSEYADSGEVKISESETDYYNIPYIYVDGDYEYFRCEKLSDKEYAALRKNFEW